MTRRAAVPVLVLAGFLAIPDACAQQSDWEWIAGPYIWAPSISTDIDVPPVGTDSRFADIIDKIDGAFLGRIEGQNERFGMFADVVYLGLADSRSFTRVQTSSDLDMSLVDVAGVWSPGSGRMQGAEVFAGLRYIDVDLDVRLVPVNPALSAIDAGLDNSFSDLLIGARYIWRFDDRWSLSLRGDGSFGDTDGTWSASAIGGYSVKYGEWLFGYRYLSVELENDRNSVDIVFDGVIAGFGFRF